MIHEKLLLIYPWVSLCWSETLSKAIVTHDNSHSKLTAWKLLGLLSRCDRRLWFHHGNIIVSLSFSPAHPGLRLTTDILVWSFVCNKAIESVVLHGNVKKLLDTDTFFTLFILGEKNMMIKMYRCVKDRKNDIIQAQFLSVLKTAFYLFFYVMQSSLRQNQSRIHKEWSKPS